MLPANSQCPNGIGAAFYDLDGTILSLDYISPRTIAAMEETTRAGCVNVVCTGRNFPIVPDILKYGSVDLYITVNGGQILDPLGNHLLSKAIPKQKAVDLAAWLHEEGAGLNCLTSICAYFENQLVSYMTQAVHRVEHSDRLTDEALKLEITSQKNKLIVNDITPALGFVDDQTNFVEKMGACFDTEQDLERCVAQLNARGDLQIAVVTPTEIEITLLGVDKGSGIEWVMTQLGLDKSQLVAFGDSGNDLPVRPYVGTFVAVDNASDEVKAVANNVVDSIGEDGVAKWLEAALRGQVYHL
ncbi:MAG: HAD-IIB family hydrolase [Coriobacteriales bacterium]|nr:HAD-IIB family hydrolase [Coriobacteriales bacterium]